MTKIGVAMAKACAGLLIFAGMMIAAPAPAQEVSWTDKISVTGDMRVRYEGFYNRKTSSGADDAARNRIRLRGRLALNARINPFIAAGIRLATGDPDNPTSANETLDDFFGRSTFNVDRLFVRFQYAASSKPVTVGADVGKFGNPAYTVSQLVWDGDLNPAGIVEKLWIRSDGILERFDLGVMQYAIEEVNRGKDAWMFGAQARWALKPDDKVDLVFGAGDYKFFETDLIATSDNTAIRADNLKTTVPDPANPGETIVTGFLSDFNLVNLNGELIIQAVAASYPVGVFVDYVVNTQAGRDATGKKQNTGVYAGVGIGKASKPGEIRLTGTYIKSRREAVLSTFSFSNVPADGRQGGMVAIDIPVLDGTAIKLTGIFTNRIDVPAGASNATLVRTQLDFNVRF